MREYIVTQFATPINLAEHQACLSLSKMSLIIDREFMISSSFYHYCIKKFIVYYKCPVSPSLLQARENKSLIQKVRRYSALFRAANS